MPTWKTSTRYIGLSGGIVIFGTGRTKPEWEKRNKTIGLYPRLEGNQSSQLRAHAQIAQSHNEFLEPKTSASTESI